MKETVVDAPPSPPPGKETSSERKRRLARNRQRRHREKLRARGAEAKDKDAPDPTPSVQRQPEQHLPPSVDPPHHARVPPHQHVPQPPEQNDPRRLVQSRHSAAATAAASAAAAAVAAAAAAQAPRPLATPPRQPAHANRKVRKAVIPDTSDHHLSHPQRSPATVDQRAATMTNQLNAQQDTSRPRAKQFSRAPNRSFKVSTAPEKTVQRRVSADSIAANRQLRQQQLQQQHEQVQRQHQVQRQSSQQQQHRSGQQFNHNLLIHQHSANFPSQSHGFTSANPQQTAAQSHAAHNDAAFAFAPANDPSPQHQFVDNTQRSFLQNQALPLGLGGRPHYQQQSLPQQQQQQAQRVHASLAADAAAGLTALPAAVNGMHGGLGSAGSNVAPNAPTNATPNPMVAPHRTICAPNDSRYTAEHNALATSPTTQDTTGRQQAVRRGEDNERSPGAAAETSEDRKRRLARERQRRRRKRLKRESDGQKSEIETGDGEGEEDAREVGGGGTNVVHNVVSDIGMHMRGSDNSMHAQVEGNLPSQFESANLNGGHNMSGMQPLQVGAVGAVQDDIGSSGGGARGGFSSHTMGVGNVNGGAAVVHSSGTEMHRLGGQHEEERTRSVVLENETAEDRKRRLARDRQRRRRSRLRDAKMEAEKGSGKEEGDGGRVDEGGEGREGERLSIGGSGGVFNSRGDMNQALGFGERAVRTGAGMGDASMLNFSGNNAMNVAMSALGTQGQNLMHWSQAFESESAARFAVESAMSTFRSQIGAVSSNARTYVMQQVLVQITDEFRNDVVNVGVGVGVGGQIMSSLR